MTDLFRTMALRTAFVALLPALSLPPASAQAPVGGNVVEVGQSAYHVPLFHNEYVTVVDVNMQPGRGSDFHHHRDDALNIYLMDYPAKAAGQEWGHPVSIMRGGKNMPRAGEVLFKDFSNAPLINRGQNMGDSPMRMIETEFTGRRIFGFAPLERNARYEKLVDNEKVKVWRLTLAPGETAPDIVQKAPGLRVVIAGGEIAEISEGNADRGMWLDATRVYWQDGGVRRAVKNIGKTKVVLIELELK